MPAPASIRVLALILAATISVTFTGIDHNLAPENENHARFLTKARGYLCSLSAHSECLPVKANDPIYRDILTSRLITPVFRSRL